MTCFVLKQMWDGQTHKHPLMGKTYCPWRLVAGAYKIMNLRLRGRINIPTLQHYQFIYSLQIYYNFVPVFESYRLETHTYNINTDKTSWIVPNMHTIDIMFLVSFSFYFTLRLLLQRLSIWLKSYVNYIRPNIFFSNTCFSAKTITPNI